jgi:glycosyltransferase involved in cell wall biosynthesis
MISVIICSRNSIISDNLQGNIDATIGCEYELIVIDNSQNKYSIFEAYNLGIEKSQGAYLCFIHDDILFHTHGWGEVVNRIFEEDKKMGLFGIAGSKSKTRMPSAWWDSPVKNHVINLMQHRNDGTLEKQVVGFEKKSVQEYVVVIDGVFMVMRKINGISFNSKMKGYHNYDLNISFEYLIKGFKIGVTKKILIEHFSQGNLDKAWYASTLKMHNLYNKYLPFTTDDIKIGLDETGNGIYFIAKAIQMGEINVAIKVWIKLFYYNPLSKLHFKIFKMFLNKC